MSKLARIENHRTAIVPARAELELSLVPAASPGQRARQLLEEAHAVSLEHLAALRAAIDVTRGLAREVVDAGDLYPAGIQALAARFSEELFWRAKTLETLIQRQSAAPRRNEVSLAS